MNPQKRIRAEQSKRLRGMNINLAARGTAPSPRFLNLQGSIDKLSDKEVDALLAQPDPEDKEQ